MSIQNVNSPLKITLHILWSLKYVLNNHLHCLSEINLFYDIYDWQNLFLYDRQNYNIPKVCHILSNKLTIRILIIFSLTFRIILLSILRTEFWWDCASWADCRDIAIKLPVFELEMGSIMHVSHYIGIVSWTYFKYRQQEDSKN